MWKKRAGSIRAPAQNQRGCGGHQRAEQQLDVEAQAAAQQQNRQRQPRAEQFVKNPAEQRFVDAGAAGQRHHIRGGGHHRLQRYGQPQRDAPQAVRHAAAPRDGEQQRPLDARHRERGAERPAAAGEVRGDELVFFDPGVHAGNPFGAVQPPHDDARAVHRAVCQPPRRFRAENEQQQRGDERRVQPQPHPDPADVRRKVPHHGRRADDQYRRAGDDQHRFVQNRDHRQHRNAHRQRDAVFFHEIQLRRLAAAGRRGDRRDEKADERIQKAMSNPHALADGTHQVPDDARFAQDKRDRQRQPRRAPARVGLTNQRQQPGKVLPAQQVAQRGGEQRGADQAVEYPFFCVFHGHPPGSGKSSTFVEVYGYYHTGNLPECKVNLQNLRNERPKNIGKPENRAAIRPEPQSVCSAGALTRLACAAPPAIRGTVL